MLPFGSTPFLSEKMTRTCLPVRGNNKKENKKHKCRLNLKAASAAHLDQVPFTICLYAFNGL